ncbi:MAG: class I SAM-dependent methyltransferase [Saprospiraceae bacterium]|nr:class I SAM-dependent methyltransferase [Saprospiraceae bacterium]
MFFRTNSWNKFRYSLYVPVYDALGRWFAPYQRQSIDGLQIRPGQKVLLVGAGTGLDLEHIPHGAEITATDLTPMMVQRIKVRNRLLFHHLDTRVMDGQKLDLPDDFFDVVILHLILAVIPDPVACLREAGRVLKPGGQIGIFDKFLPPGEKSPLWRRWVNIFTFIIATDINRRFEDILQKTSLRKISDEAVGWGGNLRVIRLEK